LAGTASYRRRRRLLRSRVGAARSKEQFEAFGQRLMPILAESGIELAKVIDVHNIIKR
jgi:hypothetical protein